MRLKHPFLAVIGLLLLAGFASAQPMVVGPDKSNGVYQVGESVHWTVEWKGAEEPPAARYTLKSGGLTNVGSGELTFSNHVARLETKFEAPGTLLVEVKWQPENRTNRAIGGAVAGAEQIRPAAPPPEDFDAFWKSKLEELAKIPANPRLVPGAGEKADVAYWKITLDNIRGTHIQGQLARPEKGEKLPALLIVQWAGVYPLKKEWVTERAAEGWLALDIEAHDVPVDQPETFYRDLFAGRLRDYWNIGNDDRDASYFLRMYLSGYQALEYLKTRPDWNGKTLVVMGTSQGGQQTLMLAGLHPQDLTAALALVPAGCDLMAPEVGRAPGWPGWYFNTTGKDAGKVHETSRYFDVANFARRIRCPVLVGLGLRDDVCPPSSVLAAVNEINSSKELVVLPRSGHQDEHGTQAPFNQRCYGAWLPALRQGAMPPERLTAQQDHQRLMDLLHITSLRPGANGSNPKAPNASNTDESKANPFPRLPEALVLNNGQKVTTSDGWWQQRQPELVELFDREVYGRQPKELPQVNWEVTSANRETNGTVPVITKRLIGHVDNSAYPLVSVNLQLTLTTPADAAGPVPVIMEFGFNFGPGFGRARGTNAPGVTNGFAGLGGTNSPFGSGWQSQVLAQGWGYASFTPTSAQADNGAGLTQGIIGLCNRGQPRKPDDWGALRAWAWGASRALDYFETDKAVDAKRVGIEGLSRYGKAAVVTMAYDPRFEIGFVASSGEGGAKLHRRYYGEMLENVAAAGEYHWMAGNFLKYAGPLTCNDLPVDSHELIALCAPRPVFISSGTQAAGDGWVDPKGMFLAAAAAGPVYELLGKKSLGTSEFPPVETALIDGDIAFRQHSAGHTAGPNWPTFLTFASRYFGGK